MQNLKVGEKVVGFTDEGLTVVGRIAEKFRDLNGVVTVHLFADAVWFGDAPFEPDDRLADPKTWQFWESEIQAIQ